MNLRPHHALCIQKFTGHGYDGRFTEHMARICEKLREVPEAVVYIMRGCDELCAYCPNNMGGSCSTLEKVDAMDAAAMDAVGVGFGDAISWAELSRRARERIFAAERFEEICRECEWFELCRRTSIN